MNEKIHVHIVTYADCRHLILRYVDPTTGKHVRKSSGTASKTEARRLAHAWEADLNSGRDKGRHAASWQQFRLRYEQEVLPSLAPRTGVKVSGVFNTLEAILPKVGNGLLRELTAERVSILQAELRTRGRAEATISGFLAHLRAALAWAVDQGLLEDQAASACQAKRWGRSDERPADHHRRIRADAWQGGRRLGPRSDQTEGRGPEEAEAPPTEADAPRLPPRWSNRGGTFSAAYGGRGCGCPKP